MQPNNTVSKKDFWNAPNRVMVHHHQMWVHFESNDDTYVDFGFFIQIETNHQNSIGMFLNILAVSLVWLYSGMAMVNSTLSNGEIVTLLEL